MGAEEPGGEGPGGARRGGAGLLAGAAGAGADALYARLRREGWIPLGAGRGQLRADDPALAELDRLGLVIRSGHFPGRIMPAPLATVYQVLAGTAGNIASEQAGLRHALTDLDRIARAHTSGLATDGDHRSVELIDDPTVAIQTAQHLPRTATRDYLELAHLPPEADTIAEFDQTTARVAVHGVRVRVVYRTTDLTHPVRAEIIRRGGAGGEQQRVTDEPFPALRIADEHTALLALADPAPHATLRITTPAMIAALRWWADTIWHRAHPTGDTPQTAELSPIQQRILTLLATGTHDADIATQLHLSVRTIGRHIQTIQDTLAVRTRFAAGAEAAHRGWL